MSLAARLFSVTLLLAPVLFSDISTAGEVFTMSQIKAAVNECNDTYFLSQKNWDSVFTTGSLEDEKDLVAKCFFECVLEKTGAMDEKGTINSDITKAVFLASHEGTGTPVQGHDELIDMCVPGRDETDICEKGYALVKCVTLEELSRRHARK
uniref:Odorant-binding protein 11 n=1 Tax=Oedaleus asiaticus TaxID=244712 RepID=A0A0E3XAR9_9ORTH|nr:odorant-binding protein 11 [Oedaleus asiaticus]